jgi:hypothetical protein
MKEFTASVVKLLSDLDSLEKIAVEAPSDNCSLLAQKTQAKAASQLYDVIETHVREVGLPGESHDQVIGLVEKMAAVVEKPALTNEFKAKLAAAVVMDNTLRDELTKTDGKERNKVAALVSYGREYIAELLRSVLV